MFSFRLMSLDEIFGTPTLIPGHTPGDFKPPVYTPTKVNTIQGSLQVNLRVPTSLLPLSFVLTRSVYVTTGVILLHRMNLDSTLWGRSSLRGPEDPDPGTMNFPLGT